MVVNMLLAAQAASAADAGRMLKILAHCASQNLSLVSCDASRAV